MSAYSKSVVEATKNSLNSALSSVSSDGVSNHVVRHLGDGIEKMNSLWTSTNGHATIQGLTQTCNAIQDQVDRLEQLVNDLKGCKVDFTLEEHSDLLRKEAAISHEIM